MNLRMLAKIHPTAANILANRGLIASDAEMEKNIGRHVRFTGPWNAKRKRELGLKAYYFSFTVVGVQRNYKGDLCYRVLCDGYADTFGCCASADEIRFVARVFKRKGHEFLF